MQCPGTHCGFTDILSEKFSIEIEILVIQNISKT